MATTRTFNAMLNQFLPNKLLREELTKRVWLLENVPKDNTWLGGDLIVPFKGSRASSVKLGSLTASNNVGESVYVRGSITSQPEAWGTLQFNERDLMEHGKISEQNFLKILPDELEDFVDYMKMIVSLSFTNGPILCTATADGDASGNITVDRPERLEIGQLVHVDDDNSSSTSGYITAININTKVITIQDARSGGSAVDISAYTTAQNAVLYSDGNEDSSNRFTALKDSLLSSANGGSSSLYGVTKTTYPYTQAINVSGAAWTQATILDNIFDAFTDMCNLGKGMPYNVVMSWTVYGYVMKALEDQKGAYHIVQNSSKVTAYGWKTIEIMGVNGTLKLVGVQEVDDDYVMYLDMRALKLYSNGFFKRRINPDGRQYFETRNTTGYVYLVDTCFFGDLVLQRPSYCGIAYSLPDPLPAS